VPQNVWRRFIPGKLPFLSRSMQHLRPFFRIITVNPWYPVSDFEFEHTIDNQEVQAVYSSDREEGGYYMHQCATMAPGLLSR